MEQVANQPEEPKITRRGGKTTPPAALFLPPPVPPQAAKPDDEQEKAPIKARKAAARRNPDFTPPVMPPAQTTTVSADADSMQGKAAQTSPAPAEPATKPARSKPAQPMPVSANSTQATPEPTTAPAAPAPVAPKAAEPETAKPETANAKPAKAEPQKPEQPDQAANTKPARRPRSTKAQPQSVEPRTLPIDLPTQASATAPKPRTPRAKAAKAAPANSKATAAPTKATKSAKAAQMIKAATPKPEVTVPAANDHGHTRTPALEVTSADLWAAVKAEPRRAPAALAVAVVRRWGGAAAKQADWLRATYPSVDNGRLARIAQRNGAARTRVAIMASAPFVGLGGLPLFAWAHSRLVLELAAIFGHDATDPRRAADLLVLTGIYQDLYDADAAVDAVLDQEREVPLLPTMAIGVAPHLIRRFAGKLLPGAGLLLDGLASVTATDDLTARATRFYRDQAKLGR